MGRNRGFTLVEVIVVIVIIAVLAAVGYNFPTLVRAREAARKATCLSNVKELCLAALMYAQDYDERLPLCVADDRNGTAHAVGGVCTNWKMDALRRDVRAMGERYVDGRWMWQLGDALLDRYVGSEYVFNCPTLGRRNPTSSLETYVVGTDKWTGDSDLNDPLRALLLGAGKRKVWQSGSYIYMCAHHPYGPGVRAADYGASYARNPGVPLLALWDAANLLGYLGGADTLDAVNPQQHLACGNKVTAIRDAGLEPLVMCNSLGVHEGYAATYARAHVLPPQLAPMFGYEAAEVTPTVQVATPVGFVDGHAKYVRMGLYDMLQLMFSPTEPIAPPTAPRREEGR